MRIKKLSLGLCLLLSGSVLAQNKVHTVVQGETLKGVAAMFHARAETILRANGLPKNAHLSPGLTLVVPNASVPSQAGYKVRNGDCDWTIARKFNTSVHKLHLANPQISDWDALQNGAKLQIPGVVAENPVIATTAPKHKESRSTESRPFRVSQDDNDWVIAHHLGVPLHLLHQLNPGVDWSRLRPGKHILVPARGYSEDTRVARSGHESRTRVNRIRTRYAVVNSDSVTIRREASSQSRRVTTVDTGTRVVVLDRDGSWYRLRFPRGTEGWVRGDFLNPSHAPASAHRRHHYSEDRVASRSTRWHHRHGATPEAVVSLTPDVRELPVIQSAVAMRGTRYSYGSSSRSATDCSGFTWQVYARHGVRLPRTSAEQAHVGMPVNTEHLKPGDLVFFSSRAGRGVHHVGMYVGSGKFIHASSGGGKVQYNSLSDPYYSNHYKGARRVASVAGSKHHSSHSESKPVVTSRPSSEDTNPTPISK